MFDHGTKVRTTRVLVGPDGDTLLPKGAEGSITKNCGTYFYVRFGDKGLYFLNEGKSRTKWDDSYEIFPRASSTLEVRDLETRDEEVALPDYNQEFENEFPGLEVIESYDTSGQPEFVVRRA